MPNGEKRLTSLGIVMQLKMLTEIKSSSEFASTFMTRDILLIRATDLNIVHNCSLPSKRFRKLHFASYTQTIIITNLQSVISRSFQHTIVGMIGWKL